MKASKYSPSYCPIRTRTRPTVVHHETCVDPYSQSGTTPHAIVPTSADPIIQGPIGTRVFVPADPTTSSDERPASPRTTVLGGFQDKTAIVAVRKLSVDAHCAQLVGKHAAHHGNHAALGSEINKDVARRPRLTPLEAYRLALI